MKQTIEEDKEPEKSGECLFSHISECFWPLFCFLPPHTLNTVDLVL